ncbi:hypothetical protein BDF22DRAFT_689420 [Syncephalis plumigaleata]|nr:hypothetical protein BDF22DRAFT_689420 [Syncephalis plumigaleata]
MITLLVHLFLLFLLSLLLLSHTMANSNLLVEKQKEVDSLVGELDAITQLSESFLRGLNDPTFTNIRPAVQVKAKLDTLCKKLTELRTHAKELGHARLEKHSVMGETKDTAAPVNTSSGSKQTDDNEDVKIGLDLLNDTNNDSNSSNSNQSTQPSPQTIFELSRGKSASVQTLFSWKMAFRQNAHTAANT